MRSKGFRAQTAAIIFLAGFTVNGANSQASSALQFEAATLKINSGPAMGQGAESVKVADGRVTITNIPLRMLIRQAFLGGRDMRPIIGADVLDRVRVDLVGKAASSTTSIDALRVMIQNLLEDRMKLVSHIENKDMPAYALTLAGNASKLIATPDVSGPCEINRVIDQASNAASGRSASGLSNRLSCHAVSMELFATQLTTLVDRPVVDNTSLAGSRSFSLTYEMQDGASAGAFAQPLREIGLRLVPQNLPIPVLVVDSVASTPQE